MCHGVQDDPLVVINIHAADQVDHIHKGIEIHLDVIIDRYADEVGNGLHRQTRPAAGQLRSFAQGPGCVDPAVSEPRNVDPHIARNGHQSGSF